MRRRLSVPFALAVALLAHASSALADPLDAEALVTRGVELRREGKDVEALDAFRRAYAAEPTPRALAQIGLAEQALGRWLEAEADLAKALAQPSDAWIARHQELLAQAAATVAHHLAWLEVEANVDGADLSINGVAAGARTHGEAQRVVAGIVVIEVRAPGYATLRRSIDVQPEARAHEAFALVPLPAAEPPTAPPLAATAPDAPPAAAPRDGARRTIAWATLVAGGALVAGGVVAQVVHGSEQAIYNTDNRCWYGGFTRDQLCGSHGDAARTAQILAVIGYATGGAALVTSAVLFFTGRPPRASGAVRCTFGVATLGFGCEGAF